MCSAQCRNGHDVLNEQAFGAIQLVSIRLPVAMQYIRHFD